MPPTENYLLIDYCHALQYENIHRQRTVVAQSFVNWCITEFRPTNKSVTEKLELVLLSYHNLAPEPFHKSSENDCG